MAFHILQLKWIMYWIVFAFFTCFETFSDVFLSWFPFYYELKVIIVIWLLSPATEGSSTLYRNFVHPMLTKREKVRMYSLFSAFDTINSELIALNFQY